MGLFDILTGNASPEVSAGLLGMGTKLLQAAGPSRMPVNTMLALAEGAQGFQQGRDDYLDRQRQKQMQDLQFKLYGLKVKGAESDMDRDERILQRLRGLPPGLLMLDGGATGAQASRGQAGGDPGADAGVSPFMQRMAAMGSSAPAAGRYGAQAYHDAAAQAGLPNPGSMATSNAIIDRVNRLGETPEVAARAITGSGEAGASGGPSSIFAAGDGAQFPSTTSLLAGLPGLPKRRDAEAAPVGQQLPFLPPTIQQGSAAPRQNATQAYIDRLMQQADIYATEGDHETAKALIQEAQKWRPKYATDFRQATGNDGKLRNYMVADDGTWMDTGLGVKPDIAGVDLGDAYELYDKNTAQPGRVFQKRQTPDSAAVDRRFAARRAAGGAGAEPSLNDETLDFLSERALRGDRAALQNLGRGAQGAANLVALNQRIAEKARAQGLTGADMAGINADYMGQSAGLRTSGNISARVENAIAEADQLAPLAINAGRNVARAGLLPFGKAQMMFDTQTNDPALKAFTTANNGLVSAYAGAMARGQKPTVSDYDHAREILAAAQSQKAYEATVAQMQLEMKAASAAPKAVREHLRNEISGRGGAGHNTPTVPNPMTAAAEQFSVTAPNGKTYTFPDRKSMNNFKFSTGIK